MSHFSDDVIGSVLQFVPRQSLKRILVAQHVLPRLSLKYHPYDWCGYNAGGVMAHLCDNDVEALIRNPHRDTRQCLFNWAFEPDGRHATRILRAFVGNPCIDPTAIFNSVLVRACEHGDLSLVCLLLSDKRVHPMHVFRDQPTPLSAAASHGHALVVARLLQDPRVKPHQLTFCAAIAKGHKAVVQVMLKDKRIDAGHHSNLPVANAIDNNQPTILALLLQDKRVNLCDRNLLRSFNRPACMAILLQDGRLDPSRAESEVLRWAAESGEKDTVALLLQDDRVDVSAKNDASRLAQEHGHIEVYAMLQTKQKRRRSDKGKEISKRRKLQ